jgi:hypothetical protein
VLAAIDGNASLRSIDTAYRAGETRSDDRKLTDLRWVEDDEVDSYKDEVKSSTKVFSSFSINHIIPLTDHIHIETRDWHEQSTPTE